MYIKKMFPSLENVTTQHKRDLFGSYLPVGSVQIWLAEIQGRHKWQESTAEGICSFYESQEAQ